MAKRIKIGVAGAGAFGGHHAAKYAVHDNSEITCVYDICGERAGALADKHGAKSTDKFSAFLDDIDAVVIASPASSHFDLAKLALRANRHVFVEKPLALKLDEADALIAEAESRELVLQVGHQERYVFEAAGLLSRESAPLRIECKRCAPATGRGMDVSAVFDLMVHDLDLVRQLTRSDVAQLSAVGDDDETTAELVLESGAVAALVVSRNACDLERSMKLVFDDGIVEFDFVNRTMSNTTQKALAAEFDAVEAPIAFRDPLAYGADRFLNSILNGEDPIVTGQHGRAAIEWALMVEDAKFISATSAPVEERLLA